MVLGWLLPIESFWQAIEVLATILRDDDHILDSHSTDLSAVQTRLDGQDVADQKLRTTLVEQRWFVHFESKAMPVPCVIDVNDDGAPAGGRPI